MSEEKVPKKNGSPPKHSELVKAHVRKLWVDGVPVKYIIENTGVSKPTVYAWCRELKREKITNLNGHKKGIGLKKEEDNSLAAHKEKPITVQYSEIDEKLKTRKVMEHRLATEMGASDSAAEQYRLLLASNLMGVLEKTFQHTPSVRNWADIERIVKMANNALGLDKKTAGGKISIDLNVLSSQPKAVTVDAKIIDEDEE